MHRSAPTGQGVVTLAPSQMSIGCPPTAWRYQSGRLETTREEALVVDPPVGAHREEALARAVGVPRRAVGHGDPLGTYPLKLKNRR